MKKKLKIAVDGPAGAGKSTIAKALALRLNYSYIDTGAMYRALTLVALEKNIDLIYDQELKDLAKNIEISLNMGKNGNLSVWINGRDITEEIRTQKVNKNVSRVAEVGSIRKIMVEQQRKMAECGGVVMDGRDIGTVVLPEADKKFYLTASINARTERRYRELKNKGIKLKWEEIKNNLESRDHIDSSRKVAPLSVAEDAVVVDTTHMTIEEVVEHVTKKCQEV